MKEIFGVEYDQLRFRLPGFQEERNHAGALVRSKRAAQRRDRGGNDHDAILRHGLKLLGQQGHLRPIGPGMRHDLGGGFAVAFDRIKLDIDARRDHQAVIQNAATFAEAHSLGLRISSSHPTSGNRDTRSGDFVVPKLLCGERSQPRQDSIAERKRRIGVPIRNERDGAVRVHHFESTCAVRACETTANDDNSCGALGSQRCWENGSCGSCRRISEKFASADCLGL